MLRVIVLGAAAGGGVPQWNCNCQVCRTARAHPELSATQASIAFSRDGENWFLVNASPDIRQQINATPQLHPQGDSLRHSPIAGVFLTNGEIDGIAGLLTLREGSPYTIYAHEKVLSVLEDNSIFNVLSPKVVTRRPMTLETPFEPALPDGSPSGLEVTAFSAPGKQAWYLEGTGAPETAEGDTIGLHIREPDSGSAFHFLAACAEVTPELATRLSGTPLVFFDGTVWRDDEMIAGGLGHKSGQRMGHMAMSGEDGVMHRLSSLDIGRRVFLHINNSNPVLIPGSAERRAVESAGWEIPHDGTELNA